jgi:putative transposase
VPRRYPAEFRRKVLDLPAAGRPVAQVAHDLQISAQVIYTWRRQQLIDSGQMPGVTSNDHAELVAAEADRGAGERAGHPSPARGVPRRCGAPKRRYEAIKVIAGECLPVQLATRVLGFWDRATTSGAAGR